MQDNGPDATDGSKSDPTQISKAAIVCRAVLIEHEDILSKGAMVWPVSVITERHESRSGEE